MKSTLFPLCTGLLLLCATACKNHSEPSFKNPHLSIEERVDDLLKRMTLEEKFWQLYMMPGDLSIGKEQLKHGIFGLQIATNGAATNEMQQMLQYEPGLTAKATAEAINEIQRFFVEETRLGIPIIPFDEALHGLIREGATVFPQAIALAATFDTLMMRRVSTAFGRECKSRGIRQILSPVVNLATDVRWGRVEESYGEDPYLSSRMGVTFVSSLEQMGIIATPKHFVANSGEGGRDSYPIGFSDRYMEETHYLPFKACFTEGGAQSVMTAYNTFDGEACSANSYLLKEKLEKEWGFNGFTISDANAVSIIQELHHTVNDYAEAGASALNNGLNVIFQVRYDEHIPYLKACQDGLVDPEALDSSVRKVLREKFRLGLFEHPYVDAADAQRWNGSEEHQQIALEAARKAIVLLKNEGNTLPLSKALKSIAIIGEDAAEARLGGYSGGGTHKISILQGIKEKLGAQTNIAYELGCKRVNPSHVPVPASCLSNDENEEEGLIGAYYNNPSWSGQPQLKRVDKNIQFGWTLFSPDPALAFDWYSVRWTGRLTAPLSGSYEIGVEGNDGYVLYIDGKKIIDKSPKVSYNKTVVPFHFIKGQRYDIRLEFYESSRNGRVRLVWNVGCTDEEASIRRAVQLARRSDAAILVVGIEEGEFRDRASISLPGRQEELINRVAETGVPVVVVLVGGSAVTMEAWIHRVPAIVDVWYPGEQGGRAVSDLLFGDYNPAGRLPITFPVSVAQLPLSYHHTPTGRSDDYMNLTGEPQFPFGHGLSYTTFEYADLSITPDTIAPEGAVRISCKVKNTGKMQGEEVVQLYLQDLIADVTRPILELKGFQRISLNPEEEKVVEFTLSKELSHLNRQMKSVVEAGTYRITLGSSAKNIRLRGFVTVRGRTE
jgi:beta-glucosidase